jgi:ABC-type glycerol-3-phosphate transport system permease component
MNAKPNLLNPAPLARPIRQRAEVKPAEVVRKLLLTGLQYAFLILMALVFLVPFIWMVSTSLKTEEYILRTDFIPNPASLDSYVELFETMPMGRMVANSVFVTVTATVGQISSSRA